MTSHYRSFYIEDRHYSREHQHTTSVTGPAYTDTGLVDSSGNKIYRFPPPIGFGRDNEWF